MHPLKRGAVLVTPEANDRISSLEEPVIRGTMGIMTCKAPTLSKGNMSVSKLPGHTLMTHIALTRQTFLQEPLTGRTMGVMALEALPFLHRGMEKPALGKQGFLLSVARVAETRDRLVEKPRIPGDMGRMTAGTLSTFHWLVNYGLLKLSLFMALETGSRPSISRERKERERNKKG